MQSAFDKQRGLTFHVLASAALFGFKASQKRMVLPEQLTSQVGACQHK
jgi:hypothetical protein